MRYIYFVFIMIYSLQLCYGAERAPNIILIYIDDLGWTDTSVEMISGRTDTKSDFYKTSHLARLAQEGMVFSDAYAPAPVCTPSRNAMLHGMTPARMLNTTLNTKRSKENYRGVTTIPRAIKSANNAYITAHFGKWHIPSITPAEAGYDRSDGATGNGEGDYLDDMKTFLPESDPKRMVSLTRKCNDFIKEQVEADRPFFLQLSHYAVHIWHDSFASTRENYRKWPAPKKATEEDYLPEEKISDSMYKHNWLLNYAAMIQDMDDTFGQLLACLDDLGISDHTYLFFTSDNGGGLRGNAPLRGSKADLTEGGIRVPFIVRGPGIKAESDCRIPVAGWDLLPTFVELVGGDCSTLPRSLDGGSIVELLHNGGKGDVDRAEEGLIFHFPWYNGEPESAIRFGPFKVLKNLDTGESSLFNVHDDLEERKDLKTAFPDTFAQLEHRLNEYLASVDAETVHQLRGYFLDDIENSWLQGAIERVEKLKSSDDASDEMLSKIREAEKYVEWLKEQVVFTRARMRLHEEEPE